MADKSSFWSQVAALIEGNDRFVLATHVSADGDGLGAEVGLYHFLRARGKHVRIFNTDVPPPNYTFFASPDIVEVFDANLHGEFLAEAQIVFLLDNSSAKRLGRMQEPIEKSGAKKVCIDHHPHPDTLWDVMAIDERASATGEMIYRLIVEMAGEIPAESAEPLYVAIITDTGNFRFSNTKPEILRIAARLVELGASVPKIYQEVYERNPAPYTRLMGRALSEMRLEKEGRLGYLVITQKMMSECGAEGVDTGDMINNVLAIDGAAVALLFKESPTGQTKVSLRSKGVIDVNRVASVFGGGGHRNASGAVIPMTIDETMERVLAEVRPIL